MATASAIQLSLPFVDLDPLPRGTVAGYSPRCLVCASPHRVQIDTWLRDKALTLAKVADRAAEHDVSVSARQLADHRRRHGLLPPDPGDVTPADPAEPQTNGAADEASLNSMDALDRLIRFGIGQLEMHQVKPTLSDVTRAIQAKEELLLRQRGNDDVDLLLQAAKAYDAEGPESGHDRKAESATHRPGCIAATCAA